MSSKYCIWDPDLRFLSLGTFTALREIALAQYLRAHGAAEFRYSFLGFYIHSNRKMRCATCWLASCNVWLFQLEQHIMRVRYMLVPASFALTSVW